MTIDVDELAVDEDLDVTGLQGRQLLSAEWTARIVCCDVLELKRRHVCRMCERPLPPRRVYCSETCRLVFESDHFWGLAKFKAKKRARIQGLVLDPPGAPLTVEDVLRGRGAKREAQLRAGAQEAQVRRYSGYRCERCNGLTEDPEINHITPVIGGNRSVTCLNHEENLELLCHACHVGTTTDQLASRRRS
jgi:predicted nucleic acid-binding Zn ribbon protein